MSAYGIVYLIRNLENGKIYVGQTTQSLKDRWTQHCYDSIVRRGYPLHLAIRKYGRDRFEVSVISECIDQAELNRKEAELIIEHRALERGVGYNVRAGGDGGGRHSDETRAKISARHAGRTAHNKGKKMPEQQRLQIVERMRTNHPCIGRIMSEESRAKIGAANAVNMLGRKRSAETKARHSAAMLRRFATEEARREHSERLKGRVFSEETRQKIRERMLGRVIHEGWRAKLRAAGLGKKQSPELIAKRMNAMREAREKRRAASL